ncbi:MAG TPA: FAD:protein FMN transferase [Firmicutes bacterium]|nr:FAD:protein FMN transferase [Candidatus Fermentithermobacillaceae bacterium]
MFKQSDRPVIGSARRGRIQAVLVLAVLVISLSGCSLLGGKGKPVEKQVFGIMDTDISIKAYGSNAGEAIGRAIDEIRRLDSLLSAYDPDSEVSAVNNMAGEAPVRVSGDTLAVIERALYFAEVSGGVFDPTIFPVAKLWSVARERKQVPSREEVSAALEFVDYRQVYIDRDEGTVFLAKKGMGIDLGAIAKGYAVDKMAEILRTAKVQSFLINAGGNVYAGSRKPDKALWRIGITDPRNPEDIIGVMPAEDTAIVSSGDYRRYFTVDGTVYHHIIDPRTGYPSETSRGTTVFLPSSTDADALSTAMFILGPDGSESMLSEFPGIGVIFITQDGSIVAKGLVDEFEFK